jgi:hypothetical protein
VRRRIPGRELGEERPDPARVECRIRVVQEAVELGFGFRETSGVRVVVHGPALRARVAKPDRKIVTDFRRFDEEALASGVIPAKVFRAGACR